MSLKKLRKKADKSTAKNPLPTPVKRDSKIVMTRKNDMPEAKKAQLVKDIHAIATYSLMIRSRVQYSLFDAHFEAHGVKKRIERIKEDAEYIRNFLKTFGTPNDAEALNYEHVPLMLEAVENIMYSEISSLQRFNDIIECQNVTVDKAVEIMLEPNS